MNQTRIGALACILLCAASTRAQSQTSPGCKLEGTSGRFQQMFQAIHDSDAVALPHIDSIASLLGYKVVRHADDRTSWELEARDRWPRGVDSTGWQSASFPGLHLWIFLTRFNGRLNLVARATTICNVDRSDSDTADRAALLEAEAASSFLSAVAPGQGP